MRHPRRILVGVPLLSSTVLVTWLASSLAWAAPTLTITNPPNGATVSGTVTVTVSASGFGRLTKVAFYLDGRWKVTDTAAPWEWRWDTAQASTGTHSLYVRGYDASTGKWTRSTTVTVTVVRQDTTPPTGSVTINTGAAFTNTLTVTLTLSASDPESGVTQMQFSNDNGTYSTPEPYATSATWTLASGDGLKTVYAKFKNGQNLWSSAVSDTITLDMTPPAAPTVNPVTSPTSQTSQVITGGKEANTGIWLGGSEVVALNGSTSWSYTASLSEGDNTFTFTAKDQAGNVSAGTTVTIVRVPPDPNPPTGTITVNDGAQYSTSATVTLTLSATDAEGPVTHMRFSNDGTTYTAPEPYATTKSWTLSAGDGSKTVYAQFRDQAGNWSAAASDSVLLDTTPPTVQITEPQDQAVITGP